MKTNKVSPSRDWVIVCSIVKRAMAYVITQTPPARVMASILWFGFKSAVLMCFSLSLSFFFLFEVANSQAGHKRKTQFRVGQTYENFIEARVVLSSWRFIGLRWPWNDQTIKRSDNPNQVSEHGMAAKRISLSIKGRVFVTGRPNTDINANTKITSHPEQYQQSATRRRWSFEPQSCSSQQMKETICSRLPRMVSQQQTQAEMRRQ